MYLAQMRVRFDTLIIYVCFYTLYFIFNLKTLREGLPLSLSHLKPMFRGRSSWHFGKAFAH